MALSDEQRREIEGKANVQGVGLDPETGEVIVFVTEKVDLDDLDDEDVVPERVQDTAGEVRETTVVPTGHVWRENRPADAEAPTSPDRSRWTLTSEPDRKRRFDPIPAGVSCGHVDITAGTWGTPALELDHYRRPVIGTNAHVGAPHGEGDANDSILQPGPHDGGQPQRDHAARLVAFSDIQKDSDNLTDLAFLEPDRDITDTILGFRRRVVGFGDPRSEDVIAKSGRTTNVTDGGLIARDVSINVRGYFPNDTARFVGVDAYTPMSQGGDSGSLMVADRDEGLVGVGFLFAGGPQATFAIPMSNVEAEFGELSRWGEPSDNGDGDDGETTGGGLLDLLRRWFGGLFR